MRLVGCHCWLAQPCSRTGGQAARGTQPIARSSMGIELRHKPRRHELLAGQCLCDYCVAKCCRYFALPLDTPKKRRDFDTLRWFLLHQQTSIFVEKGTWYL